jgi:predicted dehydrogenase
MSFATIQKAGPLRIVQVGAGGMGKAWIRTLQANPDVKLVGLVDLNLGAAEAAVQEFGLEVTLGTSVSEVALATGADAVVNVTVPAAHHPVNVEALFAGLPVLCEKPVAPTVAEGLSLAAAAEVSGQLLMISQSRRYFRGLTQLKAITDGLGDVGVVTTEFFKAPHFGGFREEMAHVLLVDMAIHPFDAVRFLLDQEPVSVYCEEFNPSWSWYSGHAAATAVFTMSGGTRYVYTGSWCADGLETSWNGAWRVNGAGGTALWDGGSTRRPAAVGCLTAHAGVPRRGDRGCAGGVRVVASDRGHALGRGAFECAEPGDGGSRGAIGVIGSPGPDRRRGRGCVPGSGLLGAARRRPRAPGVLGFRAAAGRGSPGRRIRRSVTVRA